jgi:hypothetical protein
VMTRPTDSSCAAYLWGEESGSLVKESAPC